MQQGKVLKVTIFITGKPQSERPSFMLEGIRHVTLNGLHRVKIKAHLSNLTQRGKHQECTTDEGSVGHRALLRLTFTRARKTAQRQARALCMHGPKLS
jgi:hypothetical protein